MDWYLYLSLVPESLVVSMLPPQEFGRYLATGTQKRHHGQAMFFQIDPEFRSEHFDFSSLDSRCVPHADGQPKHSVYLGIYRVLENVPLTALRNLYLTTAHGKVLEIQAGATPAETSKELHLYQEMCPVHPLIASSLAPDAFRRSITDSARPFSVPRICFVELDLGELADDPREGHPANLPYRDINHLRDCLVELKPQGEKETKTVDRVSQPALIYRCVKTGFFVGDPGGALYYPFPTLEALKTTHFAWWRCANDSEVDLL